MWRPWGARRTISLNRTPSLAPTSTQLESSLNTLASTRRIRSLSRRSASRNPAASARSALFQGRRRHSHRAGSSRPAWITNRFESSLKRRAGLSEEAPSSTATAIPGDDRDHRIRRAERVLDSIRGDVLVFPGYVAGDAGAESRRKLAVVLCRPRRPAGYAHLAPNNWFPERICCAYCALYLGWQRQGLVVVVKFGE